MIGLRSAALTLAALAVAAMCFGLGLVSWSELAAQSTASAWGMAALAALVTALATASGLREPSRIALDVRRARLAFAPVERGAIWKPRELPGWLARGLLALALLLAAAATIGEHGVHRLRALASERPSSGRCKEPTAPAAAPVDEPEPAPPQVDRAGCALVRRAYALGYSKSLGTCAEPAPTAARPAAAAPSSAPAPCERRQIDEPFLHFAWRRWAKILEGTRAADPVAGASQRAREVSTRIEWLEPLTAASGHALGATAHASHHLWIQLAAPEDEAAGWLSPPPHRRCEERYAALPLWPRWRPGQEGAAVEHALAQLLFAARFGTTVTCAAYHLHWSAPAETCAALRADPQRFLEANGSWADVAGVLDRRRRALELRELALRLGEPLPPEPPPASAVVSLSCISVEPALARAVVEGHTVRVAGQEVGVRHLRLPAIALDDAGLVELLARLAELLAGAAALPPASEIAAKEAAQPAPGEFPLLGLEPLESTDPFAGERGPLARAELRQIYPYHRVLLRFIEDFRRRYLAQRGRL